MCSYNHISYDGERFLSVSPCAAEAKSIKTEPGEVTSPPHPSNKKDEGLKRDRESQEMNDSDEDDDDDEEEEGDLLEDEEVRLEKKKVDSDICTRQYMQLIGIVFMYREVL